MKTVIEARGLKAADWNGTSDPFAEVRIAHQSEHHKTQFIKVVFLKINL
jgi:hypothetical protein